MKPFLRLIDCFCTDYDRFYRHSQQDFKVSPWKEHLSMISYNYLYHNLKVALQILGQKFYKNTKKSCLYS